MDTSTSALSTVISEKVQGEASEIDPASAPRNSAKSHRSPGNFFANIKKPHFMQNFAKNISLPSPKLRAAVKSMATYEIKVEHQVPKLSEDIVSPMSSAGSTPGEEQKVKTSSKDSVIFIKVPFIYYVSKQGGWVG